MRLCILLLIPLLAACTIEEPLPAEGMEQHNIMMHEMPVNSEAEFVVNMIPHHQEAVDTSKIIYETTDNELLKDLAKRIIDAQESEIEMMNGWVTELYSEAEPAVYMEMMPDLKTIEGIQRDNAFLKGMIMHHKMAVQMAEDVLQLNPRLEVANFAQAVIDVQTTEIAEMQALLD